MRKIILGILLIMFNHCLKSQDFSLHKFNAMTLNNISMEELFNDDISWSFFKQRMGNPSQEYITNEMDGEYQDKHFIYSGAHFVFTNYLGPYEFDDVTITSANYVFTYDGLQIKVGNNISSLISKFPQAHANRKPDRIYILHSLIDGIAMTIYYNPQDIISEIRLKEDHL